MSPEAQQIALAEACGYTNIHKFDKWKEGGPSSTKDGDLVGDFGGITKRHLPNYLGNLDAAAQAEEICLNTGEQWRQYVLNIAKTIAGDHRPRAAGHRLKVATSVMISAAAHIRAEALLRTLNLWKD